jgi:acetyl-CoA carboxylase biotin carboxyl carrier protein
MDFKHIQELIKMVNKSNLSELKIEEGDFKLTIRTREEGGGLQGYIPVAPMQQVAQPLVQAPAPQAAPAAPAPQAAPEKAAEPVADTSKLVTVKSPMIGTFYRSSGPDKEPFVKVGDSVEKGTVLCIIEAMKLFNEIESENSGKIVKFLLEDASPVEYDQPLFIIDPS